MRSAKAASETSELIEGSVARAENGTRIAEETQKALGNIVGRVSEVTDLVEEIAKASREQAEGIAQVNEGLTRIDQVTQSNTANAEESAAAAQELSGQASELHDLLARFTLRGGHGEMGRRPAAPAPVLRSAPQATRTPLAPPKLTPRPAKSAATPVGLQSVDESWEDIASSVGQAVEIDW